MLLAEDIEMKEICVLMAGLFLAGCEQQRGDAPSNAIISVPVENAQNAVGEPAEPRPSGVDGPQQPKGAPPPADDRQPPASQESYRAIGTEPFWAVTIKGSSATLERPDKAATHFAIVREADGRAIRFLGAGFSMTVTEGPCSDGMSDALWSDRVSLSFGEGILKGCGGEREEPQEGGF